MELNQEALLDELLKRENWSNTFPTNFSENSPNLWNLDSFQEPPFSTLNPCLQDFSISTEPVFDYNTLPFNESYTFLDGYTVPVPELKHNKPLLIPFQEDYSSLADYEKFDWLYTNTTNMHNVGKMKNTSNCKNHDEDAQGFNMGVFGEVKRSSKTTLEGQSSKNLMAERRRRKRLNDRLSMLRSIVPKISKMDRTSILADTIHYMKELLERSNQLQDAEKIDLGTDKNAMNMDTFNTMNTNKVATGRNSPKFEVERRDIDTRVEICCPSTPGLLMSTIDTLEALGLEIQQCVTSCFHDFSMQASCSEELRQRKVMSTEDINKASNIQKCNKNFMVILQMFFSSFIRLYLSPIWSVYYFCNN